MLPPLPYCLNIHPGESLSEVRAAIERHTLAVKARVAPDVPYPIGLRLSAAAAEELAGKAALEEFKGFLARHGLTVAGINGFPYGAFHNTAVKAAVYEPDWSTPERLNYTARLASILAALLPEGQAGNISTVPLGYKKRRAEAGGRRAEAGGRRAEAGGQENGKAATVYVRQIAVMAEFLNDLKSRTGREIALALEPEPDCLLESTDELIAWFEDELLHEGVRWLSSHKRRTQEEAEALLRNTVGLCLDTCHFAVGFEDPLTALIRFESACIRVARVQLSAAIRTTVSDEALRRLAAFADPVYLHQTRISLPRGQVASWPDLTAETLEAARRHPGCELRTHFHVPLFYAGDGLLGSTNTDLTADFFAHVRSKGYPLEIETYTFDVLPPALRAADVVDSLVKEHEWARGRGGCAGEA